MQSKSTGGNERLPREPTYDISDHRRQRSLTDTFPTTWGTSGTVPDDLRDLIDLGAITVEQYVTLLNRQPDAPGHFEVRDGTVYGPIPVVYGTDPIPGIS